MTPATIRYRIADLGVKRRKCNVSLWNKQIFLRICAKFSYMHDSVPRSGGIKH